MGSQAKGVAELDVEVACHWMLSGSRFSGQTGHCPKACLI